MHLWDAFSRFAGRRNFHCIQKEGPLRGKEILRTKETSFWILIPESSRERVSRDPRRWLRRISRPCPSHRGGKPVCGFSRNLWWLNVRSGRRCDDFIDLSASIAVSADKLDYDFMPRAAYSHVNEITACWLPIARKGEARAGEHYARQTKLSSTFLASR